MNVIDYATTCIMERIPKELLVAALGPNNSFGYYDSRSLDERISQEIVRSIVMRDCNIIGGQTVRIPLQAIRVTNHDSGYLLEVPLSATQGRKIVNPLHIMRNNYNSHVPQFDPIELINARSDFGTGPAVNQLKLVGPNVIYCTERLELGNMMLVCEIENDENLSNFHRRAHYTFSEMAILAAKNYIYQKLAISFGEGGSNGGSINPKIRELIDNYSDSATQYDTILREKWRKISLVNDKQRTSDYIRMQMKPLA